MGYLWKRRPNPKACRMANPTASVPMKTNATSGATIYYATKCTTPTTSSTKFTGAITVINTINATTVVAEVSK
jgi:hypothetical protein